jgi:hypothetical protein
LHLGWSDLASATEQHFRFIKAPLPELYDLSNDPGERRNLAASRAQTASAMGGWIARTTDGAKPKEPDAVPADVRARLKSLGYLASTGAPLSSAPAALPDPKIASGHSRRSSARSPSSEPAARRRRFSCIARSWRRIREWWTAGNRSPKRSPRPAG